jgi:hypothetical protein
MTLWVLIIMLTAGPATALDHIYFVGSDECQAAARAIEAAAPGESQVTTVCVERRGHVAK